MIATFITSGKIDYQLPGLTLYESIRETSLEKKFPNLASGAKNEVVKVAEKLAKPGLILTATSAQAIQTAQILGKFFNVPVQNEECLLPLKFDVANFMNEKTFNKLGNEAFNQMRRDFLEAFFEDKLLESNQEIKKRFEYLKRKTKKGSILLVSHAFLIKLFEIYGQIGDEMYKNRKLLVKLFNPGKAPFGRLEFIKIEL